MITHTMVFSIEPAMTKQDVDKFFGEMRQIVEDPRVGSGFDYQAHIPLPSHDQYAPIFTASALAQIVVPDIEAFCTIATDPAMGEFIRRWLAGPLPHKVFWVNTAEPLLS
jgi:hypothetical protein